MTKLRVSVFDCRCGDVIAKDVISDKGMILAAENLVLNDFIISKLKTIGIKTVWVYKDSVHAYSYYEKKEKVVSDYKETVLGVKSLVYNIAAGKRFDYNQLINLADKMYRDLDIDIILNYLNEIRGYDDYTFSHSVNVGFYSMLIGKRLHFPESKLMDLVQAGLLHDIGKIKIDNRLLNKQGKLTDEEFGVIKKHSMLGFEVLNNSPLIGTEIKKAVLMHHERIDGTGYPLGAKNEEIGEYARIVAIADVYDAMTSDRPYKKRATPFDAFNMFLTSGLCSFDVCAINTFLLNVSTHLVGARVQLDSGEVGEIVYIPPHEVISPIIRIGPTFIKLTRNGSPKIVSFV